MNVEGKFPGAMVRCSCGTESAVQVPPAPTPTPYREASKLPDHGPVATPYRTAAASAKCPRCEGVLQLGRTPDDCEALACGACGGMFVGHDELRAEIEIAAGRGDPKAAPKPQTSAVEREVRYVKCPTCDKLMNRMNFGKTSGILVDACKVHGTWFDRGELQDILAAVERGAIRSDLAGLPLPPPGPPDPAAQMLRAATVQLELERAHERRNLETVTDLIHDVLWVLGAGRPWYRRW